VRENFPHKSCMKVESTVIASVKLFKGTREQKKKMKSFKVFNFLLFAFLLQTFFAVDGFKGNKKDEKDELKI
jgi:hypothetical protein